MLYLCLQFSGTQGKLFPESRKMIYSPIYSSSARVMTSLMLFFLSSFHWNISISMLIYFPDTIQPTIIYHINCKTVNILLQSNNEQFSTSRIHIMSYIWYILDLEWPLINYCFGDQDWCYFHTPCPRCRR